MELPDCPPGAEGYQDSVVEVPIKKPAVEVSSCTKAEREFQDHVNSLKIKLEDGTTRCMVERRGRDVSGKWVYLCYPCAAMCSGESILQTHISGKKHKVKLSMRTVWPKSIFEEHPYVLNEKGAKKGDATEHVLQKMAEEVDLHNKNPEDLDAHYNKYRNIRCHIQDSFDNIKAPLIGLEYLIEHPPEEEHYEPSYLCTLCSKQGHPRTIVNHMTCFWHRYHYLIRHFPKACNLLAPYRAQAKYREGVSVIMNRLAQRVEDKYGRMRPVHIDKEEFEKNKERINQWIFKGHHFSENTGQTFEEVVDVDLICSLHKSNVDTENKIIRKEPSPPVVAAPSKPQFNRFKRSAARQERRAGSAGSLSDISDDMTPVRAQDRVQNRDVQLPPSFRSKHDASKVRYEPYHDKHWEPSPHRNRYAAEKSRKEGIDKSKAPNYEYKVKLADDQRKAAADSAKKTLAYHEKNPEKHPLYPEEWKKFWNRRYKEIQAEGKDPSKHDFKPEWIVFWTKRMKELHDEELRVNVNEIYRKLCLTPPDLSRHSSEKKSPEHRRRSPEPRRRSPEPRRRTPEYKRAVPRRRTPEPKREMPVRRRTPEPRRERKTPDFRHSPARRRTPEKPTRHLRTRSRSPIPRSRSPARTRITLESVRRSRSPLSRRDEASRNRSPQHAAPPQPSLQTVMISDDELKPDDLSPWNSDNDIDSLGSLPDARSPVRARSRTGSMVSSHTSRSRRDYQGPRGAEPQDLGPPENIVATLRLLVALEDYLGSLGPKIVDLLTEALKMEKEKANSSEELLVRESASVLIETAKEKLKGAAQAGLVPHGAAAAVRAAVVRAAATLHEADTRVRKKQALQKTQPAAKPTAAAPVPVAGVGEVDRAQIAQQMAEALIAQGKTDVSSEELAQLVDAVVGMAEAKKRETDVKKKVEARALAERASRLPLQSQNSAAAPQNTASALQMLQSAYDENDKKPEKEHVPDAMDGLSDSDLETLLKNFNELSAEEQHSLIAYLKKLEAREPERVERLRQYVSAAAATAPKPEEPPTGVKLVTIESDDDDYTVEEVFKSATEKVKEDQIRQEMEIVKKSLEESKTTPVKADSPKSVPTIDLIKNSTSATDLLALVQASIQSSAPVVSVLNQTADVVTSSTQPRSFGDVPETLITKTDLQKPMMQNIPKNPVPLLQQSQNFRIQIPSGGQQSQNFVPQNQGSGQQTQNFGSQNQGGGGFRPPNQMTFGGNRNFQNETFDQPEPASVNPWEQRPPNKMPDNRGSLLGAPPMRPSFDNFNQDNMNQGPRGNFTNGRMQDNYDTRPPLMNQQLENFDQGNNQFGNFDRGNNQFGNFDQGNNQFGNFDQGNNQFGNFDQGNNQFGNFDQGNNQFGNFDQGNNQFGNFDQGNNQFGNFDKGNNFRGRGGGNARRGPRGRGRGRF